MRNLLIIFTLIAGSFTLAQQRDNVFGDRENHKLFDQEENRQEEIGPSQRGPGTNTPDGDLEDAEPVPIDKNKGWLLIIAVAIIVYYTVIRKRSLGK
ncbi:hypothetical protein PQ459_14020 [Chryseobacterium sp. KACC 21268]|nr:hypothetical protein PQ459_14020 [Chryseobacterium sp. KACC 21268]